MEITGERKKACRLLIGFGRAYLKRMVVYVYVLNRPAYVGVTVLGESKAITYDFNYLYAVRKYCAKVRPLMTDTDSLIYPIDVSDLYQDMREGLHLFDTSDYPRGHPCYSNTTKICRHVQA